MKHLKPVLILSLIGSATAHAVGGAYTAQDLINVQQIVQGTAEVSRRMSVEALMQQASIAISTEISSQDTDGDGYPEPNAAVTGGSGPTGGGTLPAVTSAPRTDGFGREFGYCAWNNGGAGKNGASAGILAGTASPSASVFAVLSAGTDGIFQTTCAQALLNAWQGDDIGQVHSTAQIRQGLGGMTHFGSPAVNLAGLNALDTATLVDGEIRLTTSDNQLWRYKEGTGWQAVSSAVSNLTDNGFALSTNGKRFLVNDLIANDDGVNALQVNGSAKVTGGITTTNGVGTATLSSTSAETALVTNRTTTRFENNGTTTLTLTPTGITAGVPITGTLIGGASRWTTGRTIAVTGDITGTSESFDGTANLVFNTTLANFGTGVGTWGSATMAPVVSIDSKGRISAASQTLITPAWTSITGIPAGLASYAVNMNQNVRTSDAPTFAGATFNGSVGINGELYMGNGNWVRSSGASGLYFSTWGGGWHMTDGAWIRAYGDKGIYTGGSMYSASNIRADAGFILPDNNDYGLRNHTNTAWVRIQDGGNSMHLRAVDGFYSDANNHYLRSQNGGTMFATMDSNGLNVVTGNLRQNGRTVSAHLGSGNNVDFNTLTGNGTYELLGTLGANGPQNVKPGLYSYGVVQTINTDGNAGLAQVYYAHNASGGTGVWYRSGWQNAGWSGTWRRFLDSDMDFYAASMNQNVRTTDSVTFNSVTAAGGFIGNASTASNLSQPATTLATATESNAITITAPSYSTDKPVKLLNFDWYGNTWSLGNVRSGDTASNGLGVYASGVERYRFTEAAMYVNQGQGNSRIYMVDADEGTRSVHNNSGTIGFLNSSGGWLQRNWDNGGLKTYDAGGSGVFDAQADGTIWTRKYGNLENKFVDRGSYLTQTPELVHSNSYDSVDLNSLIADSRVTAAHATANAPFGNNAWYHIVNMRHRGGLGDGNVWGGQIVTGMTTDTNRMAFRGQYNGTWQPWREVITDNNIGSYADKWYQGWVGAPGYNANTIGGSRSGFSYSNNAAWTGPLAHIDAGGYGLQFSASYNTAGCGAGCPFTGVGERISFRTRNGDVGGWNSWVELAKTSGTTFTGQVNVNSTLAVTGELYMGDGNWIRSQGASGLYFQNYGGGWHMTDSSWIRAYGGRGIYTSGFVQGNSGFILSDNNDSGLRNNTNTAWIRIQDGGNSMHLKAVDSFYSDANNHYFRSQNGGALFGLIASYGIEAVGGRDFVTSTATNGGLRNDANTAWIRPNDTGNNVWLHSANDLFADAATHYFRSQNAGTVYATINSSGMTVAGTLSATNTILSTATESNSIYTSSPGYTTDKPVKLLNFDWYGNKWSMGNIRSGGTASNGFGLYASGTERYRFTETALYVNQGQNSSNIYMVDADEGTRSLHNNSGTIGFLNSSGGWLQRNWDNGGLKTYDAGGSGVFDAQGDGTIWTRKYGNLENYFVQYRNMEGGLPFVNVDFNALKTVGETKFVMNNASTLNKPASWASGMGYYYGMGGGDTGNRGFQLFGTDGGQLFYRELSTGTWYRTLALPASSGGSSYAENMNQNVRTSDAPTFAGATLNGDLNMANGNWIRSNGESGLYFQSWGGGWRMTDSSWIRAYNDKGIFTGGQIYSAAQVRADSGFLLPDNNDSGLRNMTNTAWIRIQDSGNSMHLRAVGSFYSDANNHYFRSQTGVTGYATIHPGGVSTAGNFFTNSGANKGLQNDDGSAWIRVDNTTRDMHLKAGAGGRIYTDADTHNFRTLGGAQIATMDSSGLSVNNAATVGSSLTVNGASTLTGGLTVGTVALGAGSTIYNIYPPSTNMGSSSFSTSHYGLGGDGTAIVNWSGCSYYNGQYGSGYGTRCSGATITSWSGRGIVSVWSDASTIYSYNFVMVSKQNSEYLYSVATGITVNASTTGILIRSRGGVSGTNVGYNDVACQNEAGTNEPCRSGYAWVTSSDIRLKTNVQTLTNSLDKLLKLRGVSWNWRQDLNNVYTGDHRRNIGFIAQELEAEFPEFVNTPANGGYKSVNYSQMVAVLVEGIKEQHVEVKAYKASNDARVTTVENNLNAVTGKVTSLEKQVAEVEQKAAGVDARIAEVEAKLTPIEQMLASVRLKNSVEVEGVSSNEGLEFTSPVFFTQNVTAEMIEAQLVKTKMLEAEKAKIEDLEVGTVRSGEKEVLLAAGFMTPIFELPAGDGVWNVSLSSDVAAYATTQVMIRKGVLQVIPLAKSNLDVVVQGRWLKAANTGAVNANAKATWLKVG